MCIKCTYRLYLKDFKYHITSLKKHLFQYSYDNCFLQKMPSKGCLAPISNAESTQTAIRVNAILAKKEGQEGICKD